MTNVPLPKYRLALAGRFKLSRSDGPVELPNNKLAALLAYLACTAPEPQSREKLATLLWGSHFDAQARQNLRQAVFRLRRVLGEDALISDGEDVSLAPGVLDCDVARLKTLIREGSRASLAAVLDLYRGRFLSDVNISDKAWADWVTAEQQRLEGSVLDALVRLGEIELAAGDADRALETAHRALAINNLREDAHRLIVQALAAVGRKAEALKHYQDLVALLKRELSAEPDAATKSLAVELRSEQPPSGSPAVTEIGKPQLPPPEAPSIAVPPRDQPSPAVAFGSCSPERRQLTIMVCNMVGAMPLSAGIDPEDMRDRIVAFHRVAADVAARFDGFVAQYLGDAVVVYFGYPMAHERDAEHAVRAGLAIIDAVATPSAPTDVTVQARVGIASGLVVVGEQQGGDPRQRVAIGEAPNLAARLRLVAAPGEVVIAASTRRLVGRMFDCCALGAGKLKGLPPSVEAWQVRGEAGGLSRFEARHTGALTRLVGRQEEMELLLRCWRRAKLGEGQVVLLSGEPGIGKSRIAEALRARLKGAPHTCFRHFCSPHHTLSPLYPFIAQLERAAGFEPGSSAKAKLDRLEALLKPTARNVARDLALIADLLSVPTDGRYPALAVSPQQKRAMILTALLEQLDGVATHSPVLIVFEDLHWIDPTSLDLLDRTIARVANLPVLLVATFRPEFQPAWVGLPHVTMLPLSRVGRRDSAGIIAGITRDKTLPDEVVEQVVSHTDGVPLFIEELTSMLLESGLLRETTERYVLDGPLLPLAMPTTLQASLVARLDRAGSGKDVALIGAAIGREFSHELIAAVSAMVPMSPMDLDAALEQLTASGLVSRRGTPPDATYSFKHALVQDAAYATMLKSRRRQLHASIAKVLVEQFPAMAEGLPQVVAHHFMEAGLAGEAIDHWVKAGRLAHARWANREAVKFFEQALCILESLPENRHTVERAIDLRFDLRASLAPLGEFERIFVCLREAEGLARTLGDQRRLGQTFVYMCHNLYQTGRPMEALGFGRDAKAIAESLGDVPLQAMGNLYFGAACVVTGDYRQAEDLLRQLLRLPQSDLGRARFGLEIPAVLARGYLTWGLADRGTFKEGIAYCEEAIRLAETLDDRYSLAGACWSLGYLRISRGELSHAISLLQRGLALTRDASLIFLSTATKGTLGYAYALSGRIAEGVALLEHALSASERMGYGTHQPRFLVDLGEAYVLAGQLGNALEVAERALTLARERGRRSDEARALRLLGEVTARRDSPELVDRHYRDALALAEDLGMRPLVAHCHHGLGTLYRRTGTREQTHAHVATAMTMYREMDMRFWLERADAGMLQLQ
jgi:class 3 adenylate cyclase/DNA-binding SARP family transcriptional activator